MTDETDIRQLDDHTVARIAAGEVVERPASAVKELLENALDADATRIDVTAESGGTDLVRVADDGHGMSEADVRAAVRQHTTSKIESVADLDSGISTLGFRGEALHTIGSVARVTIRSRPRGSETGTELVYEGGEVTAVGPTGCPEGTTVEVSDLFYNTPARRKFLKTTATEFAHVSRVVTRYALANPDVAVSLTHDGREIFATTGQGDLQGAVLSVYGREVAQAMIPVQAGESERGNESGEDSSAGDAIELPPGPLESVTGLISHPETNRSSREYLATYVNGRAVTSEAIREGIMGAYDGQLGDRYPFVVLFLEVPGEAVDVNVHPRKREVRFDDDDAVRRGVESAVKDALLEDGLIRSAAPRGRSALEETEISPAREEPTSRAEQTGDRVDEPTAEVTTGERVSDERDTDRSPTESTDATESETPASAPSDGSASVADSASRQSASKTKTGATRDRPARTPAATDGRSDAGNATPSATRSSSESERDTTRVDTQSETRAFSESTEQRTLSGEEVTTETTFDSLPSLRVLGQLHDTFLVCETADGLVLIDQHAADERVNYERLREAFAADPAAQALASPVELELTAVEAEAFGQYTEALSRLGFYADRTGERTVAVTTVPTVLEKTLEPETLRDVLASFVAGDRDSGGETVDALADEFLGDLACYPSITGNTSLTEGSVIDLLEALDDCENPYACPHGRPVIVSIDGRELEERFERDYPGHS